MKVMCRVRVGLLLGMLLSGLACSGDDGASGSDAATAGDSAADVAGEGSLAEDGVWPGERVRVAGVELRVGADTMGLWQSEIETTSLELRPCLDCYERIDFPTLCASGFLERAVDDVFVLTSIEVWAEGAALADGSLALGASRSAARAALGEPTLDPFADHWWYRDLGLGLRWEGDRLERFVVFAPTP